MHPVSDHFQNELLYDSLINARKQKGCQWTEKTHNQTSSGIFAVNGDSNYSQLNLICNNVYEHLNHFNEAQLEGFWSKNIAELYILNTKPYLTTGFAIN